MDWGLTRYKPPQAMHACTDGESLTNFNRRDVPQIKRLYFLSWKSSNFVFQILVKLAFQNDFFYTHKIHWLNFYDFIIKDMDLMTMLASNKCVMIIDDLEKQYRSVS